MTDNTEPELFAFPAEWRDRCAAFANNDDAHGLIDYIGSLSVSPEGGDTPTDVEIPTTRWVVTADSILDDPEEYTGQLFVHHDSLTEIIAAWCAANGLRLPGGQNVAVCTDCRHIIDPASEPPTPSELPAITCHCDGRCVGASCPCVCHNAPLDLKICIDADCPSCGWCERWYSPDRGLFGCSKCSYTSKERNA